MSRKNQPNANAQNSPMDQSAPQPPLTGLYYESTIDGEVGHSYGALGAHSSKSEINIKNPIYFNKPIDDLQEEVKNDGDVRKRSDHSKAPPNNSINGKSFVFCQNVSGKMHHGYGVMGFGCQDNTINIENPMYGFKFGGMHQSSGRGFDQYEINDFVHQVPNPTMQTQDNGRYLQMGQSFSNFYSFSTDQSWRGNNTAHTIHNPPMLGPPFSHPRLFSYQPAWRGNNYIHSEPAMYDSYLQMGRPSRQYQANECEMSRTFHGGRLNTYQAINENIHGGTASNPAKRYRTDLEPSMVSYKGYAKKHKF